MNRERWLAIKPALEKALDLDTVARREWLSELARTSQDIARDVEQLLAFEESDGAELLDEMLMIELPTRRASWSGRVIGSYHLDQVIGRGGMGSVWLAHTVEDGVTKPVAVKVLNRALLGRVGRERFEREGRMLAQMRHPNIARLIDTGLTEEGQPFLVLEYIVGTSIDAFASRADYTPRRRIALFLDVLAAVAHAHANHVIHRDIKPSNILVRDDGVAKLVDFGIAKLLAEGRELADPSSLSRESGHALTPRYASPEQIRGEPVSPATDIYALGVLLYLLLSGHHPTHEGCTTSAEQIRAVLDRFAGPLSHATDSDDLRRLCRSGLDAIVAKMLAKSPRERYRSAHDVSEDLRNLLRQTSRHDGAS